MLWQAQTSRTPEPIDLIKEASKCKSQQWPFLIIIIISFFFYFVTINLEISVFLASNFEVLNLRDLHINTQPAWVIFIEHFWNKYNEKVNM